MTIKKFRYSRNIIIFIDLLILILCIFTFMHMLKNYKYSYTILLFGLTMSHQILACIYYNIYIKAINININTINSKNSILAVTMFYIYSFSISLYSGIITICSLLLPVILSTIIILSNVRNIGVFIIYLFIVCSTTITLNKLYKYNECVKELKIFINNYIGEDVI